MAGVSPRCPLGIGLEPNPQHLLSCQREKISFSPDLTKYLKNPLKLQELAFAGQYGDMVYFCSGRGTYHLLKL